MAVRDPSLCHRDCSCCVPRCVFVEIEVPPCPLRDVDVDRNGTELKLDYGEYDVEITSRDGVVEIDYDD